MRFLTVFTHHRSVMQPIYAWSMLPLPKAKPLTVCNRLKWRNSRIFEGHFFQQLPQSQLLSKKRSTFFSSKKGFEKYQRLSGKIMQGWKVDFLQEKTCWFERSGHELNINNQPKQCFVEVKNQPNQHCKCHIFLRPSWMKHIFVKSGHQTFRVKIYTPWN